VFNVWNEAWLKPLVIRHFAICALGAYIAWNVMWISIGRTPPSVLLWAFGIPCPTTGSLRSFHALLRGNLSQSFLINPLMPVYSLLFMYSLVVLAVRVMRGQQLVLGPCVGWLWWTSLILGWAAKFALGREYW